MGSAKNDHPIFQNRSAMTRQMRCVGKIILSPNFLRWIVNVKFVEKHRRLVDRIRTGFRPTAEQNQFAFVFDHRRAGFWSRKTSFRHRTDPSPRRQIELPEVVESRISGGTSAEHVQTP